MKKTPKHYITVSSPISHRMGDVKKGTVNKYELGMKIASKHHRGSVGGGGTDFYTYETSVYMPENKIKKFRAELKKNKIRSKDWGLVEK